MKPGVKEAIRIAGSSQHEFDREMNSCRFTAQQIIDACGLRAALLAKQSLGARLSDPDYQPAIIEKREEDTPVETSVTKSQRVADWRRHRAASARKAGSGASAREVGRRFIADSGTGQDAHGIQSARRPELGPVTG